MLKNSYAYPKNTKVFSSIFISLTFLAVGCEQDHETFAVDSANMENYYALLVKGTAQFTVQCRFKGIARSRPATDATTFNQSLPVAWYYKPVGSAFYQTRETPNSTSQVLSDVKNGIIDQGFLDRAGRLIPFSSGKRVHIQVARDFYLEYPGGTTPPECEWSVIGFEQYKPRVSLNNLALKTLQSSVDSFTKDLSDACTQAEGEMFYLDSAGSPASPPINYKIAKCHSTHFVEGGVSKKPLPWNCGAPVDEGR